MAPCVGSPCCNVELDFEECLDITGVRNISKKSELSSTALGPNRLAFRANEPKPPRVSDDDHQENTTQSSTPSTTTSIVTCRSLLSFKNICIFLNSSSYHRQDVECLVSGLIVYPNLDLEISLFSTFKASGLLRYQLYKSCVYADALLFSPVYAVRSSEAS